VPAKQGRAVFAEAGLATSSPASGPVLTTRSFFLVAGVWGCNPQQTQKCSKHGTLRFLDIKEPNVALQLLLFGMLSGSPVKRPSCQHWCSTILYYGIRQSEGGGHTTRLSWDGVQYPTNYCIDTGLRSGENHALFEHHGIVGEVVRSVCISVYMAYMYIIPRSKTQPGVHIQDVLQLQWSTVR
jgi:hypothetical protein